jgi:serine-type D-Ala-D-Ala carboxypeptidase/endopeptidase (penicillin-binding protein 4)
MKNFLKLLLIFFILTVFCVSAEANIFKSHIESAISKSNVSKGALISVSFKEVNSGKKVFTQNDNVPMAPASIQKIVTLLPAINTLSENYEFKTQLYKNGNGGLYLKLGADPYLTKSDLNNMIKSLKDYKIATVKSFNIDDSILDANEWGEGWQWDDDLNPLTPKFGSYNMDNNVFTVDIIPTAQGAPADISTEVFYPTAFINNVTTGCKNDVKLSRKNYISPDVINADGTVASDMAIQIPVNYPRRYFILRLEEDLRKQKVLYYGNFDRLKLPAKNIYLISEVKHPITTAEDAILKNSNNTMAETVFKLAGGKYSNETGSIEAAVEMFNDYYKKIGINTENIKIVDGSGVSKNNLMTADFITEVLLKATLDDKIDLKNHMAVPGEGTLTDRMLYFKDKLKAKTGTLTNISSIAGYLTAKSGKTYAFCIMINDPKSKPADKKAFEEYLLREAFDSL